MSDRPSPKEALLHYFDELLAGEDALLSPVRDYADPADAQQHKLEKLLQSTREQLVVAPVSASTTVEAAVEIQEWDLAASPGESGESGESGEPESVTEENAVPENTLQESHYTLSGLEWEANGLPQWAQKDFDVLLFKVSGLTLAVPLKSLGQIQPLTDELTPLFGQADWFMGLLPTTAGKIRTVNTAKFVMPERYDPDFLTSAKYVISINGVPWGLAVDSVNQPITLRPEDVKWRSERSKRPWLAGTVKAHMCALLDVPMIGQLLMHADRNSSASLHPRP